MNLFTHRIRPRGFASGRSMSINLRSFTQYACEVSDEGGQVDVIYKTCLRHMIDSIKGCLCASFTFFGSSNELVNYSKSYLENEQQFVQYRGFKYNLFAATSGVPRGSMMDSPILSMYTAGLAITLK